VVRILGAAVAAATILVLSPSLRAQAGGSESVVVLLPASVEASLQTSEMVTTLTITTGPGSVTTETVESFSGLIRPDAGSYGPKHFTPQSPSYSGTDTNGRMTGQMTFTSHWPMAWSYRILAQPYASAATSNVTETADYYANGVRVGSYHDSHVEPISYLFHSTTPSNNGGVPYELASQYIWKWRLAKSSGTATLRAYPSYTATGSTGCPRGSADVSPNC
jgi:hypothetical protein